MLCLIPTAAYGRLGAVLSALIVCASMIGLTMHKDFYAGIRRRDYYCFYTNLSNLFVLLYFSLVAPRLYARAALRPLIPHAEFMVMMMIMLTFCVFHIMIFPSVAIAARKAKRTSAFYIAFADNLFEHYIVPWLVFIYWLLCSPGKQALGLADVFLWTLIPVIYLVFIFLRARRCKEIREAGSPYPYPFLDIRVFGVWRVARLCAVLYGICAAAGLFLVAFMRILFALFGAGHALILV